MEILIVKSEVTKGVVLKWNSRRKTTVVKARVPASLLTYRTRAFARVVSRHEFHCIITWREHEAERHTYEAGWKQRNRSLRRDVSVLTLAGRGSECNIQDDCLTSSSLPNTHMQQSGHRTSHNQPVLEKPVTFPRRKRRIYCISWFAVWECQCRPETSSLSLPSTLKLLDCCQKSSTSWLHKKEKITKHHSVACSVIFYEWRYYELANPQFIITDHKSLLVLQTSVSVLS